MADALTVERVQAEVDRFWNVLTTKSTEALEDYYAPDASVFATNSSRTEPGRIAAIRRQREYFLPQTTIRVQISPIDVQIISEHVAVASYTFQFHASRAKIGIEKSSEEHVVNGRATQVFVQDSDNRLRIAHEHLSVIHRV